ncbi:hypothetical protein AB833_02520 [Chromatiales bacterium (ex Bugula neritina AB1)]|nr:hypothetical protein AB833_02520 [Chromatiales bacterium (ex Bugula neritina AB1)]
MAALDTNVLVRYLVADDKNQHQLAKAMIESANDEAPLFVSLSVLVELEWVLRSLYEFDKATLITTFNQLLDTRELMFQNEDVVEITVSLYTENNADFADCLHIASAHVYEYTPLITFDRKASRVPGAELLA